MAKLTFVHGHPDPSEERLNRRLAEFYAQAAVVAGHEVRIVDVATMEFAVLRSAQDFYEGRPNEAIVQAQRDIAWADRIAFFFPLWSGDVPALFKAFIEQTFRPGFALEAGATRGFPKGLLTGKSARIVVTMGMPAVAYRTLFRAHSLKSLALNLRMCGVAPVRETIIGGTGDACDRTRTKWFGEMASLAERDCAERPKTNPRRRAALWLALAGVAGAAAYAGSVALAWSRFGTSAHRRVLLDHVMPEYDVRLHHHVRIRATADAAFEALRHTEFDRSPIVQALFRARAAFMHARNAPRAEPRGFEKQLEAYGWGLMAQEPQRELVFGAITQPWQADPQFRSLPPAEFARFDAPGYAKIAFTIRVDPLDDGSCVAQTETRVQTTDPAGRARFRRYWSFVAPGIELIRIVLLQLLKAEAESAAARESLRA